MNYSANVQLVNRDIVTAVIYCYITTEFHYAKRDSRCLSLLGFFPCKFCQALVYLSKYLTLLLNHFDEPKNLLELPHPTRNMRKCSNKLMTYTSLGEQGWCSGESARLPPMCPGFDSRTRRHMWAEFVGSLLCSERFFSGNSGFPLSSKTNI